LKKTATEIFSLLCEAYGESTLSKACVFEWHKIVSEGREDVEDDKQPGYIVTMKTEKMWKR
jgi:hypothetical protein